MGKGLEVGRMPRDLGLERQCWIMRVYVEAKGWQFCGKISLVSTWQGEPRQAWAFTCSLLFKYDDKELGMLTIEWWGCGLQSWRNHSLGRESKGPGFAVSSDEV